MARINYQRDKRQRDIARQQWQEEKRQRRHQRAQEGGPAEADPQTETETKSEEGAEAPTDPA